MMRIFAFCIMVVCAIYHCSFLNYDAVLFVRLNALNLYKLLIVFFLCSMHSFIILLGP